MCDWNTDANCQERSQSVGTESHTSERMPRLEELVAGSDPARIPRHTDQLASPRTKAKLSKWSKVKEAFKWERSPSEPPMSGMGYGMPMPKEEETYREIKQKFELITSSSSSEELPSDIYNFDDHPLEICLQRSSSVSDCFASSSTFRGLEEEQRRHSLTNLEAKAEEQRAEVEGKKTSKSTWCRVKNMLYTRRDSIKNKRPSRKSLSSDLSKQEAEAPGLSKSLSMASFELVSKAGDGSSDSALWLKELDAAIGASEVWRDEPVEGGPPQGRSDLSTIFRIIFKTVPRHEVGGRERKKRPPELVLTHHQFTDDMRDYSQSLSPLGCVEKEKGGRSNRRR